MSGNTAVNHIGISNTEAYALGTMVMKRESPSDSTLNTTRVKAPTGFSRARGLLRCFVKLIHTGPRGPTVVTLANIFDL